MYQDQTRRHDQCVDAQAAGQSELQNRSPNTKQSLIRRNVMVYVKPGE